MASELAARVVLQEKVRFLGSASGEQSLVIDYPPPLGDDTGIRGGLELLLMSLAACAGQTVAMLLGRMHQSLEECVIEARGQRRDEHPTILTDIELRFTCRGQGLDPVAVERAVQLGESQFCPVWSMLKGSTRITAVVEVVAADSPAVAERPAE